MKRLRPFDLYEKYRNLGGFYFYEKKSTKTFETKDQIISYI